jgi:peptidoglycan L-alanyl-D-glutamate endopeptidase CwlK
MKTLPETIKDIQREVGAEVDGVFGPATAAAVLRALRAGEDAAGEPPAPLLLDSRSAEALATLDARCRARFEDFTLVAKATAATYGCDYVAICGTRSWEEQAALYEQGRSQGGRKVTNARPGYSWHNYGVAADYGVFRGKAYLDSTDAPLAAKVHAACAVHAKGCGLAWGGHWKTLKDFPHYQTSSLPASPDAGHRKEFKERGSVL